MTLLERAARQVAGRHVVDVGLEAERYGIPFPVLLTHAAYSDAVRWDRLDLDESEDKRLAVLLTAVAQLRQQLCTDPYRCYLVTFWRVLNRTPSGACALGVLPTPTSLSVDVAVTADGSPVVVVGSQ